MDSNEKDTRAPDLEAFIKEDQRYNFVTYAQGAKMYSMPYWPFTRLAKEAKATWPIRKKDLVDTAVLDEYIEHTRRVDLKPGKGIAMAKEKDINQLKDLVYNKGKKYVRESEATELFSVGRHTVEKWARQAGAIYKINGVKLLNVEKIERFIEAFQEEDY